MPKQLFFSTIFLLLLSSCAVRVSLVTYNIRYDNKGDGLNAWDHRKINLATQVLKYKPDFIGIQEGLHHQVRYLDSFLVDYNYIGVGRDDGSEAGEYSAIFYRHNRFNPKISNTFWLSPTPDKVSIGWDAALERICTYGRFEDKSGKAFWIFNTHFDHVGEEARIASAELIIEKIKALTMLQDPVFLMGDFNLQLASEPIKKLSNVLTNIHPIQNSKSTDLSTTFNGFKLDHEYHSIIDYIFYNGENIEMKKAKIIDNRGGASYYSDHHPVWGLVKIRP